MNIKNVIPWFIAGAASTFAAIVTVVWVHTDKCYEQATEFYEEEIEENHKLKKELWNLKSQSAVNCCSLECLAKVVNRHAESIKAAENCFEVFDEDTDHAIAISKEIVNGIYKPKEDEGS